MAYERNVAKDISDCEWPKPELPADLCCDGCDTHCKLSMQLNVRDEKFMPESGKQNFYVKPVIYAGGVEVHDCSLTASKSVIANLVGELPIEIWNADCLYKDALAWCRATCKHSKMR